MSLTASYTYQKYATINANTLSVGTGYGSTTLLLTITLGSGKGRLVTGQASGAMGVFVSATGVLSIVGTAAQINAVLATMKYQADSTTGYFSNFTAAASLMILSSRAVQESGTVSFNAEAAPTYPAITWNGTPVSNVVFSTDTVASFSLPTVSDPGTAMLSLKMERTSSVRWAGTGTGSILAPEAGSEKANTVANTITFYGQKEAVQTALQNMHFKPDTTFNGEVTYTMSVADGRPNNPVGRYANATVTFLGVGFVANTPASVSLGDYNANTVGSSMSITGSNAVTYTVTFTASNTYGEFSCNATGLTTNVYNATTHALTLSGTKAAVSAALPQVKVKTLQMGPAATPKFNILVNLTNSLGSYGPVTIPVNTAAGGGVSLTNYASYARSYLKNTEYTFSPAMVVSGTSGDIIRIRLSFVQGSGTYTPINPGTISTTVFGGISGISTGDIISLANGTTTYTGSFINYDITGTISEVNAILAGLKYTPTTNFNSSFGLYVQAVGQLNSGVVGTTSFTCSNP